MTGTVPDVYSSRKHHSRGNYHPDFKYNSKEGHKQVAELCQVLQELDGQRKQWGPGHQAPQEALKAEAAPRTAESS